MSLPSVVSSRSQNQVVAEHAERVGQSHECTDDCGTVDLLHDSLPLGEFERDRRRDYLHSDLHDLEVLGTHLLAADPGLVKRAKILQPLASPTCNGAQLFAGYRCVAHHGGELLLRTAWRAGRRLGLGAGSLALLSL